LRVILYFVSSLEVYCKWKPINLDYPDKSKTKKIHRNKSSKNDNEIPKTLSSSSPKKPRLESQIKVQTPPPSSSSEIQQQELPIKPNRTERIVNNKFSFY